jgi:hypothetical protein
MGDQHFPHAEVDEDRRRLHGDVVADVGADLGEDPAALAAVDPEGEGAQMVAGGGPLLAVRAPGKCGAFVVPHEIPSPALWPPFM